MIKERLKPEQTRLANNLDGRTVSQRLTRRDWAIIRTLQRVHVISGSQLGRLHFHDVAEGGRSVARSRALRRLIELQVVAPIGKVSRPGGRTYVLGPIGLALIRPKPYVRRSEFLDKTVVARQLAITELFVSLVEQGRSEDFILEDFRTGAAAHWPDGLGGCLESAAFVRVSHGDLTCYWWVELHDEAALATGLQAKLLTYLDFAEREAPGPDGVIPRLLIMAPTNDAAAHAQFVIEGLPVWQRQLIRVATIREAATVVAWETI